jgi:hypothetical protein
MVLSSFCSRDSRSVLLSPIKREEGGRQLTFPNPVIFVDSKHAVPSRMIARSNSSDISGRLEE